MIQIKYNVCLFCIVISGGDKTNNSVEGWHHVMNDFVGCVHPSIYRLLENVIREQGVQEVRIAKIEVGEPPQPKKRKYRDVERRLLRCVLSYDDAMNDDDTLTYLRGIASNLAV